jgi:hypothetical protein
MEFLTPLLPVTVIAAIALFALKEVLETIRRRQADARRGQAFRTLLARECEINHWVQKSLLSTLKSIDNEACA